MTALIDAIGLLPILSTGWITRLDDLGDALSFTRRQLQSKFKHAPAFGVSGTLNNAGLATFSDAIQAHVGAAGTQSIRGTFRGENVIHNVDPLTGLNVIQRESGEFLSGFRLSERQLEHVLTNGNLGGG